MLPSNGNHISGMSSSQLLNSSGNSAPSSAVTTATPPPASINSVGYPIPQPVPFGHGYASQYHGHDHVLQQPDFHYQWSTNYQNHQWNSQSNHNFDYLPQTPHAFYQQPINHSRNLQEVSRRPRTIYTKAQLAQLEERFKQNKYTSKSDRVELSKALGISEWKLAIWFQNRRQKLAKQIRKNQQKETDGEIDV